MTAYGYIRVSTEQQAYSGLSMDAQRRSINECFARLKRQGVAIGEIIGDPGVSATRTRMVSRPGGRRLNALLTTGDHVVIAKLDRAFRNLSDAASTLESWKHRGIHIHALDIGIDSSSPSFEITINILAVVAAWESRRIGERISASHQSLYARGMACNGQPHFGFTRRGKRLIPDVKQIRLLDRMARLRAQGWFFRQIAEQLNSEGHRTIKGKRWSQQQVNRMLQRREWIRRMRRRC